MRANIASLIAQRSTSFRSEAEIHHKALCTDIIMGYSVGVKAIILDHIESSSEISNLPRFHSWAISFVNLKIRADQSVCSDFVFVLNSVTRGLTISSLPSERSSQGVGSRVRAPGGEKDGVLLEIKQTAPENVNKNQLKCKYLMKWPLGASLIAFFEFKKPRTYYPYKIAMQI